MLSELSNKILGALDTLDEIIQENIRALAESRVWRALCERIEILNDLGEGVLRCNQLLNKGYSRLLFRELHTWTS